MRQLQNSLFAPRLRKLRPRSVLCKTTPSVRRIMYDASGSTAP